MDPYASLPIFAQNALSTGGGYIFHRRRFNPHFERILAEWEESINAPEERLRTLQRERLDRVVQRARDHVPYYRDLDPPSAARDPREAIAATLAAIPVLNKRDYRDQPECFRARDVPRLRPLYRGRTSGTTGTSLPLWYTRELLAEEYATVWRQRRDCGVTSPRDPNLTFNGRIIVPFAQRKPPFWRHNAYSRQSHFSVYHMSDENLPSYVDAVHETPARYVEGYPSAIHLVAREMLELGRPLPRGRVAGVFTSSESLLSFQRETIQEAFAAPVRDRYGASELAVSMTECDAGRLHVDMEFCIVEVEATHEDADGITGPLLITGLGPQATPFLRYRIGDVGTRAKSPCPCGRAGDSFLQVDGRIEDYVVTPDGRRVGRIDHVFKGQRDIAEAQVVQESSRAIEVLLVPQPTYGAHSERYLMKEIRSRLGDEIQVSVRTVHSIPREANGKFRAVKSAVGRIAA